MSEQIWTLQRAEVCDVRIRFYSPRSWAALSAIVMLAFFLGWMEVVRRHFAPPWTLAILSLICGLVVFASISSFRRSPEGILHFQIDRTNVRFGGIAFRPDIVLPHPALRRVFVGDRYSDLMAPILFEFHPEAVEQQNLKPFQLTDVMTPVILRSYRGVSRENLELVLNHILASDVPVVRFGSIDHAAQLPLQADED